MYDFIFEFIEATLESPLVPSFSVGLCQRGWVGKEKAALSQLRIN